MSMTFDRKKRIGTGTYSIVHEGEFKHKKVAIKRFVLPQKSQIRIHSKKKKQQTATVVVQQPPPPKVVQPVIKH
jgi:non-homologous end joining protein Ku